MMSKNLIRAFFITLIMLTNTDLWALTLTSSKTTWYPSVSFISDSTAGDGRIGGVESAVGVITLNVGDTALLGTITGSKNLCNTPGMTWQVEAYLEFPNGQSHEVEVRRDSSSATNGGGTIAFGSPDGTSYTLLSTTPTVLFCGQGNVGNIKMQYNIKNVEISGGSGQNPSIIHYNVVGDQ